MKLVTQLADVEQHLRRANDAKQRLIAKNDSDLQDIVLKHDMKVKDLEAKLQTATEGYDRASREVQQLLHEQRTMGDRW